MDTHQPDDIQAQPPERRPEEIQAQRPTPRSDDRDQLPDYDFRKPPDWILLLAIFVFCLFVLVTLVSFFGQVTNKTFSGTAG